MFGEYVVFPLNIQYNINMNGWKNQTTLTVNVLLMENIERMVRNGMDKYEIKEELQSFCQPDNMNLYGRHIFLSAWAEIDWNTLIERATENVQHTLAVETN